MRVWRAMRVFSGSLVTGPASSITESMRLKVARTMGSEWAKWGSREPNGAHVWGWLRLANVRLQARHVHRLLTGSQ